MYKDNQSFFEAVRELTRRLSEEGHLKAATKLKESIYGSTTGEVFGALRYYLQGIVEYVKMQPQTEMLARHLISAVIAAFAPEQRIFKNPTREEMEN